MPISQTQSVIWSAIERFSGQGIQFVLSIIIARLVSPSDYGLIAMLTIFLSIAQSLIDSGFSNALIQKKNRTNTDYSTVFYFNLLIAFVIYGIFWGVSPFIAKFYNEPLLESIAKFAGLNFILSALAIVQRTQLTINLNFKLQAKLSIFSILCSGTIGIYLAWKGMGVWALVTQSLLNSFLNTLGMWLLTNWRPTLIFSTQSFKELFSFGSRMLITGLLATIYNNIYSLVIGKYFATQNLGYYNRMSTFASFPSSNITNIIARAIYPVQCNMQDDNIALKNDFLKILRLSSFIIFPLMLGLAALSRPVVFTLLSEKWLPATELLTILCFALMWNHVMYLNWQLLGVKGRSDLSLKSELYKKCISIIILAASIPFGIKTMCIGLVIYSFIDIFIIIYFVKKILPIGYKDECKSLFPILLLALSMYLIIHFCIYFISNFYLQLLIGTSIGMIYYLTIAKFFKFQELTIFLNKIKR